MFQEEAMVIWWGEAITPNCLWIHHW